MSNDEEMREGDAGAGADGGATNGSGSTENQAEPQAEQQIAALTAERDELKDRLLRLAAEFDNFKKRSRKAEKDAEAHERERVLKDVLEVMDNLERAVGAYGDGQNGNVDGPAILRGVSLVKRLFESKLERYDVRPVAAKGQPFDPRRHEAVSRVERADVPAGTVAEELQRGYAIGDRLLRPALVAVATAPPAGGKAEGAEGEGA